MKLTDQMRFRELQIIFFQGMAQYPNDKEKLEKMLKILENFIDDLVQRECSKVISGASKLRIEPGGGGRLIN